MAPDLVTLVSCGQKFPASRNALRQCSLYFEAMFASGMKESSSDEIEIRDIEPNTLRLLIDESEGRPVEVTGENVDNLLKATCLFQFERLQGVCVQHLVDATELGNAIETWQTGDTFNLRPLRRASLVKLLWEFEGFVKHASFEICPFALLRTVLSKDTVNVPSEGVVARAAEKWLKANFSTCTEDEIVALGSCVRHRSLDEMAFSAWRSFWGDSFGRWDEVLQNSGAAPPRSQIVRPAVVAYGLAHESDDFPSLAVYTSTKGGGPFALHSVLPAYERPTRLRAFVVCSVGKDVYFLGGEYGIGSGCWNQGVFLWDHALEKWVKVSTLPEPRRHCKSVVIGSCIHLCGGFGRFRVRLNSIDIYDTVTGSWCREHMHPESVAANASAVVVVNGRRCVIPQMTDKLTLLALPTVAVPLASDSTVLVCNGANNWYRFHELGTFTACPNPPFPLQSLVCGCAMSDGVGFFVQHSETGVVYNFKTNEGHEVDIGLGRHHRSIESCFGLPWFDLDD